MTPKFDIEVTFYPKEYLEEQKVKPYTQPFSFRQKEQLDAIWKAIHGFVDNGLVSCGKLYIEGTEGFGRGYSWERFMSLTKEEFINTIEWVTKCKEQSKYYD